MACEPPFSPRPFLLIEQDLQKKFEHLARGQQMTPSLSLLTLSRVFIDER
jgi:hypothetical protein